MELAGAMKFYWSCTPDLPSYGPCFQVVPLRWWYDSDGDIIVECVTHHDWSTGSPYKEVRRRRKRR